MIYAFIQARLGSMRFNSKIMQKICNKTILEHIYDRVNNARKVDNTIVLIPREEKELFDFCIEKRMEVFQGSEEDVLWRYIQAKKLYEPDHIVRITADCPLIDWKIIDYCITEHLNNDNDYTSNNFFGEETFPDGLDVEVIKADVLEDIDNMAFDKHREHVTSYIRENKHKFKTQSIQYKTDLSKKRWTIDYPEDFKLIKMIYDNIYPRKVFFTLNDILAYLKDHPNIENINKKFKRNEEYYGSN